MASGRALAPVSIPRAGSPGHWIYSRDSPESGDQLPGVSGAGSGVGAVAYFVCAKLGLQTRVIPLSSVYKS